MTKYIKEKQHGYLGEGVDSANHPFCAFKIDDTIHIVYDINTPKQHVTSQSIYEIYKHPEDYLWTPYAQFV